MIRYCIIDDEPIAHRIIEGYCKELTQFEKVGNCHNAMQAMDFLAQHAVDLIFLDINMPKLTGFDLLKSLKDPPKVIVTSAHQEYALEGYELDIVDYLLKPFSFQRFFKAVNKLKGDTKTLIAKSIPSSDNSSIFIKADKKLHHLRFERLLFIEAYGNYTKVYEEDEMIISQEKISSFELLLPDNQFVRIHKSFIVAIDKIDAIEGNSIKLKDHRLPIGQTYRNNLKRIIS